MSASPTDEGRAASMAAPPPSGESRRFRRRLLVTLLLAGVTPAAITVAVHFGTSDAVWMLSELHEVMELLGGFTAVAVTGLLLGRRQAELAPMNLWCGCGLLMVGMLDVLHGLTVPSAGFVWLRTLANLAGGAVLAMVWLPAKRLPSGLLRLAPALSMLLAALVGLAVIVARSRLPETTANGFTLPVVILNGMGGVLFLAAAAGFVTRAQLHAKDALSLFGCALLFAVSALAYGGTRLWDLDWWMLHLFRTIAYLILGLYFVREYRRSSEDLAAASGYARSLIEASLDPLVTIRKDGKIMDVNEATEKVTGAPRTELIGSDFCVYFTDPAEARRGYERVFDLGMVRDYPLAIRSRDGGVTEVVYNATVFRNQQGAVEGVFAAARDITEQKRAEEQARAASRYARSLIEASLDPLVTISKDGKVMDVNAATEAVTGRSRQELIGSDFCDYFTDPEDARRGYEQVFERGLVRDYPLAMRHRDGHTADVLYNAAVFRNEAGDVDGVFAAARDITARKRAELELRRLNRALRAISRCTSVVARAGEEESLLRSVCEIVVQDGGYPLAWVGYAENDREKTVRPVAIAGAGADYVRNACITWADTERGRGPTGICIRSGTPCYAPEITLDPRFLPWREAARRHGYASSLSIPLREAGRSFGALSVYAPEPHAFEGEEQSLMLELAATLAHGILALRARQERDRAASALQELNETLERRVVQRTAELAAATEDMESFTYSVSHDLRAPLRHIDGFSKVLLEECSGQLEEVGRHYLERVRQGTQQMGHLVDDLLKLSRLGRCALQLRPTPLAPMVQEVVDELQPEAAGRAVEWHIGALPVADCDRGLMHQVLFNLLANALKFTRGRAPAIIEMGTCGAELFVRDNGVGFDPQYAGKLFGVFQRLHRSEEFPGAGVGLATVRRILRKHGGDIRAESTPNAGATFYFTLGPPDAASLRPALEEWHAA